MTRLPGGRILSRVKRGGDDTGLVLMVVICTMLLVTAFVTAGLTYASATERLSRGDQDYNGAMAAAQAGVEDFIAQLNRNDNYARQNPFTDCANIAVQGPKAPQPNSCGWTSATAPGWRPVDPGRANGAEFHYDIDASDLGARGTIDVRSTGRVNGQTRTLQVAVGRGGSTDFLYYTDHEDGDPENKVMYPSGMHADCYSYWWGPAPDAPSGAKAPRSSLSSSRGCQEITFIGGDVFDGKVHTNDTPLLTNSGATRVEFKEGLQTADPKCKASLRTDPDTWKNCDRTGIGANYGSSWPQYASPLYLEDNSAKFKTYPGCQYTGATRIKFNSGGTMTVWSLETLTAPASCGGDKPWNKTVAVPNDQVVYVKSGSSKRPCASQEIDGVLPLGTRTGADTQMSYTYDENMNLDDQYCGQGNAYVEGTVQGRVTVAAENSIVLTEDVKVTSLNGTDMLGLVAGNSVEVFQPVVSTYECAKEGTRGSGRNKVTYCQGYKAPTSPSFPHAAAMKNLQVHASIQALQHSFFVQSYNRGGAMGNLTVIGSIAQKWRGAVGQGTGASMRGYLKDYRYDRRLKFSSPPYFPQFINAVWSGRTTGEIPAQY
jgi:hypothetical protein